MGCKINKKHPLVEDSVKDIKKSETLDLSKLNPPPAIPIEKDIRFKASELIGEKKGNILDHYIFETDLGSGNFIIFFR